MNPLTKSISLTHVQYISGDHVGRILAWSCLFPFIIIVALSTLVATRTPSFPPRPCSAPPTPAFTHTRYS